MNRILIADAGSTKTDWILLTSDGSEEQRISTPGYNALLATPEFTSELFGTVRQALSGKAIECIYFYGAGCATQAICSRVETDLCRMIGAERAIAASDLLGAARGSLGHNSGIACILGTGSNSCLYDGEKIVKNIPSLGFILGDEGSGSALGKRLVADVYKEILPQSVCDMFVHKTGFTAADILERVYRQPAPNKFLASFVPFLKENIEISEVKNLVKEEFSRFFNRNISAYDGAKSLPISFTGGVANAFGDVLREVAESLGYKVNRIVKSPAEGLIAYHTAKL